MKQEKQNEKVCAVIAYGDENILYSTSEVVEQIVNAGVINFLVGFKQPFNKWATFACLLLNNKYKHMSIKLIEPIDNVDYELIKENKKKRNSDVIYCPYHYNKEEIYKAIIDQADIVVTNKHNPDVSKYAEENNKSVVVVS